MWQVPGVSRTWGALALVGVACSYPPPPSHIEGPVGPSLLRDELLRWSDRQLALTGQLDTHPAACLSTCEMAGRICRLEDEVCEKPIAEFEDPGFAGLCQAAAQTCEETTRLCHCCTERHAENG